MIVGFEGCGQTGAIQPRCRKSDGFEDMQICSEPRHQIDRLQSVSPELGMV